LDNKKNYRGSIVSPETSVLPINQRWKPKTWTRSFITAFKRARYWSLPWARCV